jgi:hypothetical protein
MIAAHVIEYLIAPPATLPDIHVMLNVLISSTIFGLSFVYLNWKLFAKVKIE